MEYSKRLQLIALGVLLIVATSHAPLPMVDRSLVAAQSSEQCHFSDFLNLPSFFDYLRNSTRAQEWLRYMECLTRLGESIEGMEEECFISMNPVYNPDTGDHDVESYVVCTSLL